LTGPYKYDGRFETLQEVAEHDNSQIKAIAIVDSALQQTVEKGLLPSEEDKKIL